MGLREEKRALRRLIKEQKAQLSRTDMEREAAGVFSAVATLPLFQKAETVLAYWAMGDELPTADFVDGIVGSKRVALPVVQGDDLLLLEYTGRACLQRVPPFGIEEPQGTAAIRPGEVDLVVVPGVAFDRAGNRMGRGRGFYDRLFAQMPDVATVGVCLSVQLVESVPVEAHDRAMEVVVCGDGAVYELAWPF